MHRARLSLRLQLRLFRRESFKVACPELTRAFPREESTNRDCIILSAAAESGAACELDADKLIPRATEIPPEGRRLKAKRVCRAPGVTRCAARALFRASENDALCFDYSIFHYRNELNWTASERSPPLGITIISTLIFRMGRPVAFTPRARKNVPDSNCVENAKSCNAS